MPAATHKEHEPRSANPLAMIAAALLASALGRTMVWWEAETPARTNRHNPANHEFSPRTPDEVAVLSGGAWFGLDATPRTRLVWAEYLVDVPASTRPWRLYVRKFWKHGPFRWRFGHEAWHELGPEAVLLDDAPIRQFVGANWVYAGEVELEPGRHRFRIELGPEAGPAGIDCFALVDGLFHPRGALVPGQTWPAPEPGWVVSEPGVRPWGPLSLRHLNHRKAGERGWLRRDGSALRFEHEARPTRFWGVTVTQDFWRMEPERIERVARELADAGVNLVRFHLDYNRTSPDAELDAIHDAVGSLKRQGIYSYLGFYCLAVADSAYTGMPADVAKPGGKPFGLLFFHPQMQERYRAWARTLFLTPNRKTGVPLARDPAVAMVELVDEDNYFFWTFTYDNFTPESMALLERRFGAWLACKYGSVEGALAAWGSDKPPAHPEHAGQGRVAFYDAGRLGGAPWAVDSRNPLRAADQARFLTEDLRALWAEMSGWFKRELGYRGVVVATNWTTADSRVLGPLDKYTNMAADALAQNGYFGGEVRGPNHGFGIPVGNWYRDESALLQPEQAVLMQTQYADPESGTYPHVWSEGAWNYPNRFRSEMPLLMAAYASQQGIDALCPFVLEPTWRLGESVWSIQDPAGLGQFPAAALLFRQAQVPEAEDVVNEALDLEKLYRLEGAAAGTPQGLDPIRAAEAQAGMPAPEVRELDPLAYLVGRVVRTVGERDGRTVVSPHLGRLIDRQAKRVVGSTGALALDYGQGRLVIDTSHAQGVLGFAGEPVDTRDARFALTNEFSCAALVSLDRRPLARSKRMLLQVMTEQRNNGWRIEPHEEAGVRYQRLVDGGHPPLLVRALKGQVSFRRNLRFTPLAGIDGGFRPFTDGRTLELSPNVTHYLVEEAVGR